MQELLLWVRDRLKESSPAPRYVQLASALELAIEQHRTFSGQFLPAERSIAQWVGLSRVTVSRALSLLEEKGLIVRQQGVGTRISPHLDYSLNKDEAGFTALILREGGKAGNRWLERSVQTVSAEMAREMGLPADAKVSKLRRVRLINDEPASLETTWIPYELLPEPELLEYSLYQYWASRQIYPNRKSFGLKAVSCDAEAAELLGVRRGAPLLLCRQHTYDADGALMEYCEILCRSDIYEIRVGA